MRTGGNLIAGVAAFTAATSPPPRGKRQPVQSGAHRRKEEYQPTGNKGNLGDWTLEVTGVVGDWPSRRRPEGKNRGKVRKKVWGAPLGSG